MCRCRHRSWCCRHGRVEGSGGKTSTHSLSSEQINPSEKRFFQRRMREDSACNPHNIAHVGLRCCIDHARSTRHVLLTSEHPRAISCFRNKGCQRTSSASIRGPSIYLPPLRFKGAIAAMSALCRCRARETHTALTATRGRYTVPSPLCSVLPSIYWHSLCWTAFLIIPCESTRRHLSHFHPSPTEYIRAASRPSLLRVADSSK